MNVRIQQQNLKFKVTTDELTQLLGGESITATVSFPDRPYYVRIKQDEQARDRLCAGLEQGEGGGILLTLLASQSALQELRDMGRNREGLSVQQGEVTLILQVDFRRSKPEKGAT